MLRKFIWDQLTLQSPDGAARHLTNIQLFSDPVYVHPSASATFYAPSDLSGVGGMHRERIRAVPRWHKDGRPRYDCVLVETDPDLPGMRGLDVARVFAFLSFRFHGKRYPCALVHWFSRVGEEPDEQTGMWIVKPDVTHDGSTSMSIIHLDCISRGAHLIPVYGQDFIPTTLKIYHSLDLFHSFYVNKYADHHTFEIVF